MTIDPNDAATGTDAAPGASAAAESPKEDQAAELRKEIDGLKGTIAKQSEDFASLMDQLRARSQHRADGEANGASADRGLQAIEEFARRGDPVAAEILEIKKQNRELIGVLTMAEQLRDYPKDKRPAIIKHWQANQHRFASIEAAAADMEGQTTAADKKRLEEENQKLRDELKKHAERGAKVDASVIRTDVREEPAGERKSGTVKMTQSEFDRQQEQMTREGRTYERMAQQRALQEGRIDIVG